MRGFAAITIFRYDHLRDSEECRDNLVCCFSAFAVHISHMEILGWWKHLDLKVFTILSSEWKATQKRREAVTSMQSSSNPINVLLLFKPNHYFHCFLLHFVWNKKNKLGLHGGVAVSTVVSQREGSRFDPRLGPFCVEFACSLRVCVASLRVLRLPPTVQKHAC